MNAATVIIDGVHYRPSFPDTNVTGHKFHDLMRVHRKSYGWTLEEAAQKIGITRGYLHGLEAGKNEPSLRVAFLIQCTYDLSMKRMALSLKDAA
jgi:DNA-binding XRE family transcriptional regulator